MVLLLPQSCTTATDIMTYQLIKLSSRGNLYSLSFFKALICSSCRHCWLQVSPASVHFSPHLQPGPCPHHLLPRGKINRHLCSHAPSHPSAPCLSHLPLQFMISQCVSPGTQRIKPKLVPQNKFRSPCSVTLACLCDLLYSCP